MLFGQDQAVQFTQQGGTFIGSNPFAGVVKSIGHQRGTDDGKHQQDDRCNDDLAIVHLHRHGHIHAGRV